MDMLDTLEPHKMCLLADPELMWTLVVTDLLTSISYLVIPLAMVWLIAKQYAAARSRTQLFMIFIAACGINHLLMAITMFWPWYYALAITKIIMAVASVTTAAVLWRSRRHLEPI